MDGILKILVQKSGTCVIYSHNPHDVKFASKILFCENEKQAKKCLAVLIKAQENIKKIKGIL